MYSSFSSAFRCEARLPSVMFSSSLSELKSYRSFATSTLMICNLTRFSNALSSLSKEIFTYRILSTSYCRRQCAAHQNQWPKITIRNRVSKLQATLKLFLKDRDILHRQM